MKYESVVVAMALFLASISSLGAWILSGSFGAFLFTLPILWVLLLRGAK